MSRISLTMVFRCSWSIPSLSERAEMSGAVEMAESFLVTSCESFLSLPITVTLDFLRVLWVPEPEARLRQESGCREDMLQCYKCHECCQVPGVTETEKCDVRQWERVTASGNQFFVICEVNGRDWATTHTIRQQASVLYRSRDLPGYLRIGQFTTENLETKR